MTDELPPFLRIEAALRHFATTTGTQDQGHIRPLHKYLALRLVIEGGYAPEEVTPRPPLRYESRPGADLLIFDASQETSSEQTIIGGLKSKDVDVSVNKHTVGPVICVSVKGSGKAFRNLTNRMEEIIGDCANLHMMYPGLIYGFFNVLKANRPGEPNIQPNDVSVRTDNTVTPAIERWHNYLSEISGRKMIHDDVTRYESAALLLTETSPANAGQIFASFPLPTSPLSVEQFFRTIYELYDLRFAYKASMKLGRLVWSEKSPALTELSNAFGPDLNVALGYSPRI